MTELSVCEKPVIPRQPLNMKVRKAISNVEEVIKQMPGHLVGDCYPLKHSFADGLYIREITVPAKILTVTKIHKYAHVAVLLKGKIGIFFLIMFISTIGYAKNMTVETGYGYLKDKSGDVICKVRLSPGIYPLNNNGLDYVEVANKQALDAIEVYVEPESQVDKDKKKKARKDSMLDDLGLTAQDIVKIKALP